MNSLNSHLDDMDHFLRAPKISPKASPEKIQGVAIPPVENATAAEAAEEKPLTAEEKKEGIKMMLKMLRKDKKAKEGKKENSIQGKSGKKLVIRNGQMVVISGDGDEDDEKHKKQELLQKILEAAQNDDLDEVSRLTRERLAELHGTDKPRTKVDLLKALKAGSKEVKKLKKALFRMAEGLSPDGMEFLIDAGFWEGLVQGKLTMGGAQPPVPAKEIETAAQTEEWQASLSQEGYFKVAGILGGVGSPDPVNWSPGTHVEREIDNQWYPAVVVESPPPSPGQSPTYNIEYTDDGNHEEAVDVEELRGDHRGEQLAKVQEGVAHLQAAGWPASFIFMFDEAWSLVQNLWPLAEQALGTEVLLDPRLGAQMATPKQSKIDMSGRPQRSHTYSESYGDDGQLHLLHTVALLSAASTKNGGVCVVPREYDQYYDASESWEHGKPSEEAEENVLSLRFGIQSLRPLQGTMGSVLGLAGNIVHWGSRCSEQTESPATSVRALFRHSSAGPCQYDFDPLTAESVAKMSIGDRLCHVARALLLDTIDEQLSLSDFPEMFKQLV